MSGIRDVVARMAADAAFAERVRSHPDEVAQQYGLSSDEIDKVRSLAEADAQSGPEPLGVRLSKSGITGGVLAGFLAGAADPMATAEGGDVSKAEFVTFDPQPDPPGGPHVAEAALGGPDTTTAGDPGDDAGIIIHWTPDPDAFDYGVPDTQPADGSDDGGIIINWKPELDAFDDPDSQGIIIHDMPDPADGAYGVPDTTPDPNDADARGNHYQRQAGTDHRPNHRSKRSQSPRWPTAPAPANCRSSTTAMRPPITVTLLAWSRESRSKT